MISVYVSSEPIGTKRENVLLVEAFKGNRKNRDLLVAECPQGTVARYVQVHCPSARAWFNVYELEVFRVSRR